MARPRTVSDDAILEAAARVVAREGALRFTLAQVGEEAGLSAPAIIQRFGSKRDLLLALSASSRHQPGEALRKARAAGMPAADAIVEGLAGAFAPIETPQGVARSLEYLALDMTDAAFHAHAVTFFDALNAEVRALLRTAIEEGDLVPCDVEALARALEVAFNGAVVTWGVRHDGPLPDALRRDLDAVLAPFRTRRRRGRGAPTRRARRPASDGGRASRGR